MPVRIRPATLDDASALVPVHHAAVDALPGTHYTTETRAAWCAIMRLSAVCNRSAATSEDRKVLLTGLEEVAARTLSEAERLKFLMSERKRV